MTAAAVSSQNSSSGDVAYAALQDQGDEPTSSVYPEDFGDQQQLELLNGEDNGYVDDDDGNAKKERAKVEEQDSSAPSGEEEGKCEDDSRRISMEMTREMAIQALALSVQDWNMLGQGDDPSTSDDALLTDNAFELAVQRVTALLLVRIVALRMPKNDNNNIDNVVNRKTMSDDLSTSGICRRALIDEDYPWYFITDKMLEELRAYVRAMLRQYSDTLPFHSFRHAVAVVVNANKLLELMLAEDICGQLQHRHHPPATFGLRKDPMLLCALLFAALVHDVQHQGVTNRQLVSEKHNLALLYNDQSVQEMNSLYVALSELKKDEYQTLFHALFAGDDTVYRYFRNVVVSSVLATDIASPGQTALAKSKWKEAFGHLSEAVQAQQQLDLKVGRRNSLMSNICMPRKNRRGSNCSMLSDVTTDFVLQESFPPSSSPPLRSNKSTRRSMDMLETRGMPSRQNRRLSNPDTITRFPRRLSADHVFRRHPTLGDNSTEARQRPYGDNDMQQQVRDHSDEAVASSYKQASLGDNKYGYECSSPRRPPKSGKDSVGLFSRRMSADQVVRSQQEQQPMGGDKQFQRGLGTSASPYGQRRLSLGTNKNLSGRRQQQHKEPRFPGDSSDDSDEYANDSVGLMETKKKKAPLPFRCNSMASVDESMASYAHDSRAGAQRQFSPQSFSSPEESLTPPVKRGNSDAATAGMIPSPDDEARTEPIPGVSSSEEGGSFSVHSLAKESIGVNQKRLDGARASRIRDKKPTGNYLIIDKSAHEEQFTAKKPQQQVVATDNIYDDDADDDSESSSISVTPPSSEEGYEGGIVAGISSLVRKEQQAASTSSRQRRASTGMVSTSRFSSVADQRIDEDRPTNTSFHDLQVQSIDPKTSFHTLENRFRKRLGIRRSMDLSGEAIEVYSRKSSMVSPLSDDEVEIEVPDFLRASTVLETMLRAADVGYYLQGWGNLTYWFPLLYMELAAAYRNGRGNDPGPSCYDNQLRIMESYLMPLALQLEDMGVFGDYAGTIFAQNIADIRTHWEVYGQELTDHLRQETTQNTN